MKKPSVKTSWFFGAALLLMTSVMLDAAGVLRPLPSAASLLGRMDQKWSEIQSCRADIAVKYRASGPAGATVYSRQWWFRDRQLSSAIKDRMDFVHFEEWEPGIWRYHQAGLNLETTFQLQNSEEVPFARWAVSDMPAMEDLIAVIRSGREAKVVRRERVDGQDAWVLTTHPMHPSVPPPGTLVGDFYSEKLGPAWTIHLSAVTGLPVRILIGDANGAKPLEISVRDLVPGIEKRPDDWKRVNETVAQVEKRMRSRMNLSSNESIHAALKPLGRKVDDWRRMQYPKTVSPLEIAEPAATRTNKTRAPYEASDRP